MISFHILKLALATSPTHPKVMIYYVYEEGFLPNGLYTYAIRYGDVQERVFNGRDTSVIVAYGVGRSPQEAADNAELIRDAFKAHQAAEAT